MSWLVLIASGVLEAVWASALAVSKSLRRPRPTILFVVALVASMAGLAFAMTDLPGTAYAVWAGIGASLAVIWAIATGKERASTTRILLIVLLVVWGKAVFIAGIVAAVVGLKLVPARSPAAGDEPRA